jgi:hypothetical protein
VEIPVFLCDVKCGLKEKLFEGGKRDPSPKEGRGNVVFGVGDPSV